VPGFNLSAYRNDFKKETCQVFKTWQVCDLKKFT